MPGGLRNKYFDERIAGKWSKPFAGIFKAPQYPKPLRLKQKFECELDRSRRVIRVGPHDPAECRARCISSCGNQICRGVRVLVVGDKVARCIGYVEEL